jgi:CRISPR/Cas system-associated protein endoribonuclease Cas2
VTPFKFDRLSADTILNEILPKPESEALASKTKDTDGDGLTDYDEVALYATSPYLPDTDSDGFSDGKEVKEGTDPNCKPGEVCGGLRLVTPDTKISDLFPQFSTSNVTLKDKTVQEFRQILIDQGFDKENLDKISDTTLLIMLEESLKAQDQGQGTSTPTSTDTITEKDYDNLRLLLIDLGVPKDEVYSMSNKDVEDLLKTFK